MFRHTLFWRTRCHSHQVTKQHQGGRKCLGRRKGNSNMDSVGYLVTSQIKIVCFIEMFETKQQKNCQTWCTCFTGYQHSWFWRTILYPYMSMQTTFKVQSVLVQLGICTSKAIMGQKSPRAFLEPVYLVLRSPYLARWGMAGLLWACFSF